MRPTRRPRPRDRNAISPAPLGTTVESRPSARASAAQSSAATGDREHRPEPAQAAFDLAQIERADTGDGGAAARGDERDRAGGGCFAVITRAQPTRDVIEAHEVRLGSRDHQLAEQVRFVRIAAERQHVAQGVEVSGDLERRRACFGRGGARDAAVVERHHHPRRRVAGRERDDRAPASLLRDQLGARLVRRHEASERLPEPFLDRAVHPAPPALRPARARHRGRRRGPRPGSRGGDRAPARSPPARAGHRRPRRGRPASPPAPAGSSPTGSRARCRAATPGGCRDRRRAPDRAGR